jgi:hypothetical protein
MKKYIFFMTDQKLWMEVSKRLYNEKIAEPVLWIGDDRHQNEAKSFFGDIVYSDLIHRHRNYQLKNINYDGQAESFFKSDNYKRAKDISLKMMDRLDLYGTLGRLDREVYFHNLLIFYLRKIVDSKPEILITAENPHDYPKYIIYEICDFLDIPCFKFNNWNIVPLMFVEKIGSNSPIIKPKKYSSKYDAIINQKFKDFVLQLTESSKYELSYMKKQRMNVKPLNQFFSFFRSGFLNIIKDSKHNIEMQLLSLYNPINPYRHGILKRNLIRRKRKLNLRQNLLKNQQSIDLKTDYIYFPLHFEPERTTNPDGGFFHDQFLALQSLRKFVPDNIKIVVKEHPSQINMSDHGSRGRSPLFYNLIKNLKNTSLIDINHNSVELIKGSKFVATITGTVVIEASLLGVRGLTFGYPWYNGCPNVTSYSKDLQYDKFILSKIYSRESILDFFKYQIDNYTFLSFQNQSQRNLHKEFESEEFLKIQFQSIYDMLEKLFKNS